MTAVEDMAQAISRALPHVKSGSLSVFGDVFGGRIDNIHVVTRACAASEPERLVVEFDGGETLEVWEPNDWSVGAQAFSIQHASRIRWEWYYYGKPQLSENRYFVEHVVADDGVVVSTNVDWYQPSFSPNLGKAAVELLGLG